MPHLAEYVYLLLVLTQALKSAIRSLCDVRDDYGEAAWLSRYFIAFIGKRRFGMPYLTSPQPVGRRYQRVVHPNFTIQMTPGTRPGRIGGGGP